MHVCVRLVWSCMGALDMSGHVCVLDMSGHVCVC